MKPKTRAAANAMVELIGQSVRLNGRLLTAADRMSREFGLSGARWQLLSAIARATRPATNSDIARWMGLARQSVQRVADALAADGLIAYEPNPNHRRAQLVALTEKGRNLLGQLDERRLAWASEVAATLPPADLEAATRILRTVGEKLRN